MHARTAHGRVNHRTLADGAIGRWRNGRLDSRRRSRDGLFDGLLDWRLADNTVFHNGTVHGERSAVSRKVEHYPCVFLRPFSSSFTENCKQQVAV